MYTTAWCGYCVRAKAFLDAKGLPYEEIRIDERDEFGDGGNFRSKLFDLTGGWTVPQITIDSQPIGGYSELRVLDRTGRLDELVERSA